MQNLKDKESFEPPKQADEQKKVKPLEGIPDIHEVMKNSGLECVREAQAKLEAAAKAEAKNAKEAQAKAQAQERVEAMRERARRMICCCRSPGCGIGPMIYEE